MGSGRNEPDTDSARPPLGTRGHNSGFPRSVQVCCPVAVVPRITWRVNRWQRSEDQPGVLGTRIHDRSHPGERCDWVAETTRIEGLGERAVLCRRDEPIIEPRFGGGTGTSDPYVIAKAPRFDGDHVLRKAPGSRGDYELAITPEFHFTTCAWWVERCWLIQPGRSGSDGSHVTAAH